MRRLIVGVALMACSGSEQPASYEPPASYGGSAGRSASGGTAGTELLGSAGEGGDLERGGSPPASYAGATPTPGAGGDPAEMGGAGGAWQDEGDGGDGYVPVGTWLRPCDPGWCYGNEYPLCIGETPSAKFCTFQCDELEAEQQCGALGGKCSHGFGTDFVYCFK